MGRLLEYAYSEAKNEGYDYLYISDREQGRFKNYGFASWKNMNEHFEDSYLSRIRLVKMDYHSIISQTVRGSVDRPLGRRHPDYPEMIYPVNYGYVDDIYSGDGEEQDVYVLGIEEPIIKFTGQVIAVWHRINDVEDKWIC